MVKIQRRKGIRVSRIVIQPQVLDSGSQDQCSNEALQAPYWITNEDDDLL
jgi:hypothetical protein